MIKRSASAHRILLKISGESLTKANSPSIFEWNAVDETVQILVDAHQTGLQIAIMCGGGNIMRGSCLTANSSAKLHDLHRADADEIGMLATMMNSIALQSRIRACGVRSSIFSALPITGSVPAFNRHDAIHALEEGDIVLLAGGLGKPYFTTDSAAVLRGLELECDMIVKATKVNGVYDDDPEKNPNARRYDRLSYDMAIEKNLKIMDQTAFTLAKENDMQIAVLCLLEKHALKALQDGTGGFTIISNEMDDSNV